MSRFDEEYDSPDDREESENAESIIRERRAEIIRLESQLDQLTASVREQTAESVVIAAQLTDLEIRVARLEARRRRDLQFLHITWAFIFASIAMTAFSLYAQLAK